MAIDRSFNFYTTTHGFVAAPRSSSLSSSPYQLNILRGTAVSPRCTYPNPLSAPFPFRPHFQQVEAFQNLCNVLKLKGYRTAIDKHETGLIRLPGALNLRHSLGSAIERLRYIHCRLAVAQRSCTTRLQPNSPRRSVSLLRGCHQRISVIQRRGTFRPTRIDDTHKRVPLN